MADRPRDFTSGTLYAAKLTQETSGDLGGTFGIEWIDLGHATSEEIEEAARTIKFSDLFEMAEPDLKAERVCPEGFEGVNAGTAGLECLKLKEGASPAVASRLESRRYSAMLGATTELTKLEGITYDPQRNKIYAAVSSLKSGMMDGGSYDAGDSNDIRVEYNKCGCIYSMDLGPDHMATKVSEVLF